MNVDAVEDRSFDGTGNLINGKLYAINPNGTQQWLVQLGWGGAEGPVIVGPDGTIYVASSVPTTRGSEGAIFALNPDGTQKWVFDQTGAFIIAGPGLGPDGNIYAVTDLGDGDELGLFSLTPAGALRFAVGSFTEGGPTGEEIVFGSDQLHFAFDGEGLFAYDLNGNFRWNVPIGVSSPQPQAAIGPNGNVVIGTGPNPTNLTAYTPSGAQAWTFYEFPGNTLTYPDVGPDNVSYVVRNLSTLHAFNANGTQKWRYVDPSILFEPVVSPDNDLVFMGGRITYGEPGLFFAASTAGKPLWQVNLPTQPGFEPYGQLVPISRPAFSPDGNTAYTVVDVAGDGSSSNPYSFLYAIDTSSGPTPTTTTTTTPGILPSAPTSLAAVPASSSVVNLTWTDKATNETSYLIERCTGRRCAAFVQIASVGANITSFSNTGLAARTDYSYRVRAANSAGNSPYSDVATAKTPR